MEFVPYRVLRNKPSALRQQLREQGELVVTVDGKPFAVMIDLGGSDNMDEIMLLVSRLRAQIAARAIRSQARREDLEQMSAEQVDALIQKARQEKAR